ncbi:DUF4199 domain-containing protein [Hyphobacterium sp. CCMP332]|nr:DUF4199 domain-containing protein [Hyphobacterium sp. CCMP332]
MNKLGLLEKTGLKWGIITFLGLGAYFLIMKAFGLTYIIELRVLNAAIMFTGLWFSIKDYKRNNSGFDYFSGLGVGLLTAFIASTIFAVFGILYLEVINPSFMTELKQSEPLGFYLNPYLATFQIFIEGTASGFSISYAIMQFLKKPMLAEVKEINKRG